MKKNSYNQLKNEICTLFDDVDLNFLSTLEQKNRSLTENTMIEILQFYQITKFEHIEKILLSIEYKMPYLESNSRNRVKLATFMEKVNYYIVRLELTKKECSEKYQVLYRFILKNITKQEDIKRDKLIRFIVDLGVMKDIRLVEDIYNIFGYCFSQNDWYDCALGIFVEEGYAKINCSEIDGTRIPFPIIEDEEEITYIDEESCITNNQRKYERILKSNIFDKQFTKELYIISRKLNQFYTSIHTLFDSILDTNSIDYIDFKEISQTKKINTITEYLYNYIKSYGIDLNGFNIEEEMLKKIIKEYKADPLEILIHVKNEIIKKANKNKTISDKTILLYLLASKRDEVTRDDSYSKMYELFYPWDSRTSFSDNNWMNVDENLYYDLVNYVVFIYIFSSKELNQSGTGYRSIMDNIDKASVIGCMKKIFLQKLWVNKLYKYDALATKIVENFPNADIFVDFFSPIIENIMKELKNNTPSDEYLKNYYEYHIKELGILSCTKEEQNERLTSIYNDIYDVEQKKNNKKKGGVRI